MKKWLKILLLIALLAASALAVMVAMRPSPMRVETANIACGALRVTIDAEGKTRVRDRFAVASPVTGRLARIALHRGDQVERNALLARIDPLPLAPLDPRQAAEARARVAAAEHLRHEAEAVVARARADCEQARREFERAEKLVETGDIARQEFERLRTAEQTCRQQLEAATFKARAVAAEVEVAKAALLAIEQAGQSGQAATVFVHAPVGGRVLRVLEESERVVTAGTPLLELSGQTLEIVIDVLSVDAVKVQPGAPVWIEGWGGEQPLQARVRLIEPSAFTKVSALGVEEQRVNVIADFTDAVTPLGDGYRIEAQITLWDGQQVLQVPTSALFRKGRGWSVFVVENGLARERKVEIGHRNPAAAEIRSGLAEGATVILHPTNELADGLRVKGR